MATNNYIEGYLKGYEEGLTEAWNDVVRLTTKGLTGREISLRAKAVVSTIYQTLESKRAELGKSEPASLPQREAPQEKAFPQAAGERRYITLSEGGSYIVKEAKPEKSLKLFTGVLGRNVNGLCISRINPAELKNSLNSARVKIMWLTKPDDRCNDNCVLPDLSGMQMILREFMNRSPKGVIMLDGVNYLISHNGFSTVLKFIQSIRDDVARSKCTLIVPLEPGTMETKEYKQLEQEMQVV